MLRWLVTTLAQRRPSSLTAQDDSDAIIVTGVVGGISGGGGFRIADDNWTSSFHLVAWRVADGPVRTDELRVEIPGQRAGQLQKWASVFPARTLVRFAIREPVCEMNGRALAVLRAPLPRLDDAELLAAADVILNPPPIIDPQFGTFTRDERFPNSFNQKREWLGREIEVTLSLDDAGSPGPDAGTRALDTMRGVWSRREDWDSRIRDAIAAEYYELWRDEWRSDDQLVIDRQVFKERFLLESIVFTPEGSLSLMFGDSDLFWGHGMAVNYTVEEDRLHVSMFG